MRFLIALLLISVSAPAGAELPDEPPPCMEFTAYDHRMQSLGYQFEVAATVMLDDPRIMHIFVSSKTEDWVMTETDIQGDLQWTCPVRFGVNYHHF